MTVLNELDRFHLVISAIERMPRTGDRGMALQAQMRDKLREHHRYIRQHGEDMPEVRDWVWPAAGAPAQ
jgi:xylulose-5-phosphate/fructose-6-phosphate phosphoketolase